MEFLVILLIILSDQGSKLLVRFQLKPVDTIDIIKDFFSLTYVENRGAAFGFFASHRVLLIGVTSLVVIAMLIYLATNRRIDRLMKIGLILVIAGAVGNLIDRIYLGYVVDFLHVYLKNRDFPVFNIADISVVFGTFLLAISLIMKKE